MNSRRDFLKKTCGFCLAVTAIGMTASLLESCASVPVVKASPQNNSLRVPLASFGESKYVFVRAAGLESDILLVKKDDGTFTALLMQCTHEAQPLTVSGTSIYCASHGSRFDLNGNVTKEPATRALQKYFVTNETDSVLILLNR